MAEMVHDGWYAQRRPSHSVTPAERAERAQRAAALYKTGMKWPEIRAALRCDMNDLGNLIREGGVVPQKRNYAPRPDPPIIGEPRIDRWTREVQATPSPCMDAALDRHTAAIWQMHADLGIAPPVLP